MVEKPAGTTEVSDCPGKETDITAARAACVPKRLWDRCASSHFLWSRSSMPRAALASAEEAALKAFFKAKRGSRALRPESVDALSDYFVHKKVPVIDPPRTVQQYNREYVGGE